MTSDSNETGQALILRFHSSLEGTIVTHGSVPVDRVDKVMQLQQINMVDSQTPQRVVELPLSTVIGTVARFCGQKEVFPAFRRANILGRSIREILTVEFEAIQIVGSRSHLLW